MSSYDSKYGAGGSMMASSLPNMSSIPSVISDNKSQQDRMRNKYYLSLGMNRPSQPPPSNPSSSNSSNVSSNSLAPNHSSSSNSFKSSSNVLSTSSPIHSPLNGSPNKERSVTVGFMKAERPINVDSSSPSESFSNRSRRSNTTPIPFNPAGNAPSAPINMPLGSLARRYHLNESGNTEFDSEDEDSDYGNPLNRSTDDMPPQTFEEDFFLQKQKLKHQSGNSNKQSKANKTNHHSSHHNRAHGHQRTDSEDESPFIPPHLLMKQNAPTFEVGTAHSLAVENRRRNMMDNL
eukprot:TRINITY_DN10285_c0_g1_i1.p1 TRINITY_DN10285_c0_g1~~TRINITY_DN10285_c0_g1_i1.p1  ORF type:complete len:291 (-),score=118.90 TRINITY_DN10285_c0_g1_i1:246-1118(-)